MSSATSGASSGIREVELSIRGMTCAACAARVEKRLDAMDEVLATVNFATEKATVTVPPSVRVDQRRLIVEVVLFVPLSDLSVLLSLFPAYRFPGWQWVLVAGANESPGGLSQEIR